MKLKKAILAFLVGCLHLFPVPGVSGNDTDEVSVMEGDSVILHTGVNTNKADRMTWYFNNIRIAYISGDKYKICTDDRCPQRFRGRLNLTDSSLTIININTSDAGVYEVEIPSRNIAMSFSVTLRGVSAAERDQMKRKSVKEGESVTLDTRVMKNSTDLMTWYLNDIIIAEITGDQSKICSDVQCEERFRDRLKLDHQTGSLTITNTRNTDSGEYELKIISSRFSIVRSFTLTVSDVPDSGSSSAAVVAVFVVLLLLLLLVAAVVFYKHQAIIKCTGIGRQERRGQRDYAEDTPPWTD